MMRILGWVHSKISIRHEQRGKQGKASSASRNYCPDEPDDQRCTSNELPHGFLAIGTLDNSELNCELPRTEAAESSCSAQDIPDFSVEELNKLQSALAKLLSRKSRDSRKGTGESNNLPLDRFLNCPSSLEIDRCTCQKPCNDAEKEEGCISPATKAIINRLKDTLVENHNAIHRKSFAFLLKKVFVCRGGFGPAPSLRDPLPASRIEKLLKAIVHKKIFSKNPARGTTKMLLDKRPQEENGTQEEIDGQQDNQCKWVKTDPDYIVLEI